MILIKHRINKIEELINLDPKYGAEIDIRSYGNDLILQHDPFVKGELFNEWIKFFKHKFLILNVKEEGLEESLIKKMNDLKIKNYFFLDQSFPFLLKFSKLCNYRSAIRFSEYEAIQTPYSVSHFCSWVWVDCFNTLPLTKKNLFKFKKQNYKICLVSPELQNRFDVDGIIDMKNIYNNMKLS